MPLINGQKMACEPCIRGHRSTKCTHARDRLMVPVRKPGRPLSQCPHPSSRPCSCAVVTAAIPRKQKCGCGPSDKADSEHKSIDKETSIAAIAPPSPSKPSNGTGFRVQKQVGRTGQSRQPSIDLAGLQRMDAQQINILPSYGDTSPQQMSTSSVASTPMSDLSLYGPTAMTPSDGSFHSDCGMFPPLFPYNVQPQIIPMHQPKPMTNDANGLPTNGLVKQPLETSKDCCGGAMNNENPNYSSLGPPQASNSNPSSCCSKKPSSSPAKEKPAMGMTTPPSFPFPPGGVVMPPFQPGMAMNGGLYPFYNQPNVFNYPPQYGSYMQPLQPEQWRQIMVAMTFAQTGMDPSLGMPGQMGVMQQQQQTSTPPNESDWTLHQCNCGDSCSCIGCAAHPYNEATQEYVYSAWSTTPEESAKARKDSNGPGALLNGDGLEGAANGQHPDQEDTKHVASNGTTTPVMPNGNGTWSPKAAQTPSDSASGIGEEQALSDKDFFFVSYAFGDSCAGETASCPCGDDCQCIGCAIHNIPGPSQDGAELLNGIDSQQTGGVG